MKLKTSFRLSKSLHNLLRKVAESSNRNVSEVIEEALISYFDHTHTTRKAFDLLTIAYEGLEAWRDLGEESRPFGEAEVEHLRRVRIAWDALHHLFSDDTE